MLWSIIGVTSLSIYIEASFWPNWDGAWHQTMVRDTALTPTHIPMFYFFFPLSVVLGPGRLSVRQRHRIPALYSSDKGFPWSFFLLISAAVLECMEVAFNEWGHSLWISEEFFAVPFHWPFVAYGWLACGDVRGVGRDDPAPVRNREGRRRRRTRIAPSRPQAVAD